MMDKDTKQLVVSMMALSIAVFCLTILPGCANEQLLIRCENQQERIDQLEEALQNCANAHSQVTYYLEACVQYANSLCDCYTEL